MRTVVRRLFEVALFIGLFLLSVRYIPLSHEWTPAETRAWISASDWLGIRDPEDLYFWVCVSIDLIVTVIAYVTIMRLWRQYQGRKAAQQDGLIERSSYMAELARALFKVALFVGLLVLSGRFVGEDDPLPKSAELRWLSVANGLGLREADAISLPVFVSIWLIVAVAAYVAIMKLWQWYQGRNAAQQDVPRERSSLSATLTCTLFKVTLFIGLFVLAMRCTRESGLIPDSEAFAQASIAQGIGSREVSDVFVPYNVAIPLIIAALAYGSIMKLWRHYRGKEAC
ncbi:hypothetical protein [Paraburkholderia sp. ZP32-5]|uniref:hypothetical protein n=1 Tax=Paraburkholderia sp. ZP32-5 TaxID=2883245 RepID=UPI002DD43E09|nr:hypothetical protein [Paraburkholderia sp. ZP32-5]